MRSEGNLNIPTWLDIKFFYFFFRKGDRRQQCDGDDENDDATTDNTDALGRTDGVHPRSETHSERKGVNQNRIL